MKVLWINLPLVCSHRCRRRGGQLCDCAWSGWDTQTTLDFVLAVYMQATIKLYSHNSSECGQLPPTECTDQAWLQALDHVQTASGLGSATGGLMHPALHNLCMH